MRITPRFVKSTAVRGCHNFPDSVPVLGGLWREPGAAPVLSGRNDGTVSIRADIDGPGDPAVYVEFTGAELDRMAQFSRDLRNGKPMSYAMPKPRTYLVDGQHRATVAGWYAPDGKAWHVDSAPDAIACETCSLSLVQAEALALMARLSLTDMTVQGCRLEWLV